MKVVKVKFILQSYLMNYGIKDGRGGWLCNRCTERRRYYDRRAGNETKYSCFTSKETYQKLRFLRFHKERYGASLTRIVDYYIKNRLGQNPGESK